MRWILALLGVLMLCATAHGQETVGTIAGRVLDADGNAVSEATVWLTSENWETKQRPSVLAKVDTDAEGRFEFTGVALGTEEGPHTVCAYKQGWAFAWAGRLYRPDPNVRIVLEKEFPLRGRVIGPDGEPVAGIRPEVSFLDRLASFDPFEVKAYGGAVLAPPAAISEMMATASNERGEFELRHLPPGIELSLKARDDRYAYTRVHFAWRDLTVRKFLEFRLEPPGTIRGRVSRQGEPVAGVTVSVYSGGTAVTDKQGRYEITNLRSGAHQVYLRELPTEFTAKALTDVTLQPGETREGADLAIVPGVQITGAVTDRDTGEPLEGAGVCCNTAQQPEAGMAWPVVHTDESGRYSLRAPEGPARVRPFGMPKGWRPVGMHGSQMRNFTVLPGQGPIEMNFKAVRAEWTISGTVLRADDRPAAYARVLTAQGADFPGVATTVADSEGGFVLENREPDAACFLHAHLGDDMTLEDQTVEPGDERPVTLRLAAGVRPALSGVVMGEDGRPVAHALLRASCGGVHKIVRGAGEGIERMTVGGAAGRWRALNCYGVADEHGRFMLRGLWPGMPQTLRARRGGYAEQERAIGALEPAEIRDIGEISLPVADLVITGRVVDDHGDPVVNAMLDAWRMKGHFSRRFMAWTDLDGRFRFEGLPREQVRIRVDQFDYDSLPQPAGPEDSHVLITAIPRDEQILFRHEVVPPREQQSGDLKATLRGLYRFKGFTRDGELGQYLGLDIDIEREPETRWPSCYVFDDRGHRVQQSTAAAKIEGYTIDTFELPEAEVRALSRIVISRFAIPEEEQVEFGPLRPLEPAEKDHRHAILWSLELTDEWIGAVEAEEAVTPGEPPYLSARVYIVSTRDIGYELISVTAQPDGPELVPRATSYCDPTADTLDAPFGLPGGEQRLKEESASALATVKDWGRRVASDPIVVGCWFQSQGGHGDIPLPESLTVTVKPTLSPYSPAVVFSDIPIPTELTTAMDL